MTEYIVQLPRELADGLFENLRKDENGKSSAHEGIRGKIRAAYNFLEKVVGTNARTPAEAVRNAITKQKTSSISISSLLKMLGPTSQEYVFVAPEKENYDANGERIPADIVETFQIMEVAIELADRSNTQLKKELYTPGNFHEKAYRAIKDINEIRRKNARYSK